MSRGKGHIPIRRCISCNARRAKKDLIRLVLTSEGTVVRDADGNEPGRGAYVCPVPSCLGGLKAPKRLKRAFRTEGAVGIHPDAFRIVHHGGTPNGGIGTVCRP
jgi:uncharacterized protein